MQFANSATLLLWMFLIVFSIRKTLKTKLQKAQNKCIRFYQDLSTISQIDPSHIRKINWTQSRDRVKHCTSNIFFKYWDRIVQGYNYKMFKHIGQDH